MNEKKIIASDVQLQDKIKFIENYNGNLMIYHRINARGESFNTRYKKKDYYEPKIVQY